MATALITGVFASALAGTVTAVGVQYNIPPNLKLPILNVKSMFLSNNTYYSYVDTIQQVAYIFTFRYSTRETCWYLDIHTTDNIPVILSTKLIAQYPILEDFNLNGITGFFWLYPNVQENIDKLETEPKYIADYFTLLYFYEV